MKRVLVTVMCSIMALNAFSQTKPQEPKNAFKIGLFGFTPKLLSGRHYFPVWWYNFRYERKISRVKHLSYNAEIEYRQDYGPYDEPLKGETIKGYWLCRQRDLSLLLGIKYGVNIAKTKGFCFSWFAEPRLALVWRKGYLTESIIDLPDAVVNKIGVTARIRSGLGWVFFNTMGIEIAADFGHYKQLGNTYRQWLLYPEVNLTFWF
jgi:hypothetical protein